MIWREGEKTKRGKDTMVMMVGTNAGWWWCARCVCVCVCLGTSRYLVSLSHQLPIDSRPLGAYANTTQTHSTTSDAGHETCGGQTSADIGAFSKRWKRTQHTHTKQQQHGRENFSNHFYRRQNTHTQTDNKRRTQTHTYNGRRMSDTMYGRNYVAHHILPAQNIDATSWKTKGCG